MAKRFRGAFVPFAAGVLVAVVAVFAIQSLSPGTFAQFLVKLPVFDTWAWLSAHVSASDAWAWLRTHVSASDPGKWLRDHQTELTGVGALAAGIGLFIAGMGLWVNAHTSSWNSSRDCLWNFHTRWNSLLDSRVKADEFLKTMQSHVFNEQLGQVLNFFDTMAFMGNRGHLDDELAWTNYFEEANDLWRRSASYILWRQNLAPDPTLWCEIGPWVVRLAKLDAKHKKKAMRRRGKRPELKVRIALAAPSAAPSEPAAQLTRVVTPAASSAAPSDAAPQLTRVVTPAVASATPSEAPAQETTAAKTSDAGATVVTPLNPETPSTQAGTDAAPAEGETQRSPHSASQAEHPPKGPEEPSGS
jgi:hypothetical protein